MTEGSMFWFIVGGICTLLFFGIALVVAFRGLGELRDLLNSTARRKDKAE